MSLFDEIRLFDDKYSSQHIQLINGKDYELIYDANDRTPGKKQLTISGKGNWINTINEEYEVYVNLERTNITLPNGNNYSYTENPIEPKVKVELTSSTPNIEIFEKYGDYTAYTIKYANNINLGSGSVTVESTHGGSKREISFNIIPSQIQKTLTYFSSIGEEDAEAEKTILVMTGVWQLSDCTQSVPGFNGWYVGDSTQLSTDYSYVHAVKDDISARMSMTKTAHIAFDPNAKPGETYDGKNDPIEKDYEQYVNQDGLISKKNVKNAQLPENKYHYTNIIKTFKEWEINNVRYRSSSWYNWLKTDVTAFAIWNYQVTYFTKVSCILFNTEVSTLEGVTITISGQTTQKPTVNVQYDKTLYSFKGWIVDGISKSENETYTYDIPTQPPSEDNPINVQTIIFAKFEYKDPGIATFLLFNDGSIAIKRLSGVLKRSDLTD